MLNSSSCAEALWTNFFSTIGLDLDGTVVNRNIDASGYPDMFATEYDNYAKAGIVPGAATGAEDKTIIETALRSYTTVSPPSSYITVTTLATAFANYWSTVLVTPGAPAHGGTVVISVVNDAMAKVSLFEEAIWASLTSSRSEPFFYNFINNIERIAVSSIIWSVTELIPGDPPSASSFPETIS